MPQLRTRAPVPGPVQRFPKRAPKADGPLQGHQGDKAGASPTSPRNTADVGPFQGHQEESSSPQQGHRGHSPMPSSSPPVVASTASSSPPPPPVVASSSPPVVASAASSSPPPPPVVASTASSSPPPPPVVASSSPPPPPADEDGFTAVTSRRNRVSGHRNSNNTSNSTEATQIQAKYFPPLVFPVPKNWGDLILQIQSNCQRVVATLKGANYVLKTTTQEDFTFVKSLLASNKVEFHTFSAERDTELKVVLRGLHHSHDPADLAFTLEKAGFKVLTVQNIKSRGRPINLFMIKLKKEGDYKKIYSLTSLFLLTVSVEAYKPRPGLPQCFNCQRFGHSSLNCFHTPRCVKCGENHTAAACTRDLDSLKPTCVNCQGAHTANYRGCKVHLALLNRTTKSSAQRPTIAGRPPVGGGAKNPSSCIGWHSESRWPYI